MFRQTDFLPWTLFTGMCDAPTINILGGAAGTAIGIVTDADGAALTKNAATTRTGIVGVQPPRSAGVGNPVLKEISTLGMMGLLMEADGDNVVTLIRIPDYWDREQKLRFRVIWTTASVTAADTIDWKILYNVAAVDAIIPTTAAALSTVIAQDTVGGTTARVIKATANGILNAGVLPPLARYIVLTVEMDDFAAGLTEDKWFLGLEIEHTVRQSLGRRLEGRAFQA